MQLRIFRNRVFSVLPAIALALLVGQLPTQAQIVVPETAAGKKLSELLKVVGNSEKSKRDVAIVPLFTDEEDPEELRQTATIVHDQTGGISVLRIVESKPTKIKVIAKTQHGPLLEIQLSVTKSPEHLIQDLHFGRHEEQVVAKPVGDLVPVFDKDKKTLPAARGVWLAKGYGYVAEVTEENFRMYDYTGKYGWGMEEDDDKLALLFRIGKSPDHALLTYHPKEPGYNLVRLKSLPSVCSKEWEWTPTRLFDLFADIMTTHYPFFKVRGVDWQALVDEHRPLVSDKTSERELFDVMEKMLSDLNDGHTGLHAEIDGVQLHANTGRSKTMKRLRAAFEKMPEPKSKGKVLGSFHRNIDKCVLEQVLGGKGKQVCANKFTWGLTHPDIGYLNISGMGGYSLGDTDAQVEALHKALDNILAELKDTKAIIIDISMNGGGSDLYSMEIAAHFADKKRLGFSKWPAAVKEYRNDRYVTPYTQTNPQGIAYTKPVYLVTNDYTASAAEIFTMCMRSFPHVTTVGTPTSGALSDVLDKSLPNDWTFHTSNEIYTDHEGVCHEGPGIPPDVTMDIFDKDDILKVVHHETIAKVVKLALERDGDGEGKNVQD